MSLTPAVRFRIRPTQVGFLSAIELLSQTAFCNAGYFLCFPLGFPNSVVPAWIKRCNRVLGPWGLFLPLPLTSQIILGKWLILGKCFFCFSLEYSSFCSVKSSCNIFSHCKHKVFSAPPVKRSVSWMGHFFVSYLFFNC